MRQQDLADQPALPRHGVDHAVPAGELHALGGGAGEPRLGAAVVGRLFRGTGERQQLVGAYAAGVHDLGGQRVALGLPGGHQVDLGRRVGAGLQGAGPDPLDDA